MNRIEWIDTAKGLGIILVIAGHTFSLRYSAILYSFHMPLFFLLSALVYNHAKYRTFNTLFKAKSLQLLRPWLICYVISFVVSLAIPVWREALSWKQMLIEFYTTNSNNINNSSIWYFVCLFVSFLLFHIGGGLLNKLSDKVAIVVLGIIGILFLWMKEFLSGVSPYLYLIENRLPFKVDSALIAVVFLYVGFRYREKIFQIITNTSYIKLAIAIIILICGFVVNRWSNINSLDFGNYKLLYYPIALIGSYCVLSFCYLLSKNGGICLYIRKILYFYGFNSLIIFGFQSLFIRLYLLFFNQNYGYSMVLYGDNPMIHQVGSFMVVTFIISPILVFTFYFLRKHNIKLL